MSLDNRIRQIEKAVEMNGDMFPVIPDFDNMDEENLTDYFNQIEAKIKEKFDLDEKGIRDYFKALGKYEQLCKTDELKAAKFISGYEQGLIVKKWEKETGRNWNETSNTN